MFNNIALSIIDFVFATIRLIFPIAIVLGLPLYAIRLYKRNSDRRYELDRYKAETERMRAEAEQATADANRARTGETEQTQY